MRSIKLMEGKPATVYIRIPILVLDGSLPAKHGITECKIEQGHIFLKKIKIKINALVRILHVDYGVRWKC